MSVQVSKSDYEGATSLALSLVRVSSENGRLDRASVLDALLAWIWDTSVDVNLSEVALLEGRSLDVAVTLIAGRIEFGQPTDHPQAAEIERHYTGLTLRPSQASSPEGEYFRIEDCGTFTPTTSRTPASFIDDLTNIARLRLTNVSEGRLINHGMPFTEEEKDEMVTRHAAGAQAEELSSYFQRTLFSIVRRLEELGLIETDVQSLSEDEGDHLDGELPEDAVLCEGCDEPIPKARLEIFPYTRLCVECAQDEENEPDRGVVFPPVPAGLRGKCPRCNVGVAVVYQNHTDKNFFVGCSTFPSCRWSTSME